MGLSNRELKVLNECEDLKNLLLKLKDKNGVNYELHYTTQGKRGIEEKSVYLTNEEIQMFMNVIEKCYEDKIETAKWLILSSR